jgi:polyisoprenoid-binding protein YceI
MKKTILLMIILVVFVNACTSPSDDLDRANVGQIDQQKQINNEKLRQDSDNVDESDKLTKVSFNKAESFFEFEGYGPGKSHIGTFDDGEMYFLYDNDKLVGFIGTIIPASVKSDSGGLDKHLKTADFFNIDNFSKINAVSTNIDKEKGQINGELTFLGVTKELTFPATITDNSVEAELVFDTTLWGMSYTGVNPEVRVSFKFVAKE